MDWKIPDWASVLALVWAVGSTVGNLIQRYRHRQSDELTHRFLVALKPGIPPIFEKAVDDELERIKPSKPQGARVTILNFLLRVTGIAIVGIATLCVLCLYLYITANPGAPDVIQFWDSMAELKTSWQGLVDTIASSLFGTTRQ
jgi:hypothetical protein